MDWLFAPIDPTRAHEVSAAVSWHARTMVLAWGVIAPLAVLIARYFKIMPGQDWPRELDNQTWWRCHWMGQSLVVVLTLLAIGLVFPPNWSDVSPHNGAGYLLLLALLGQVLLGVFRGSKGGPTSTDTDGSLRGHHYDMTPRRKAFELSHKALGYLTLFLAMITILLGLWKANGPVWMWLSLTCWWLTLIVVFIVLQKRGYAIDTYQAIWGDDPIHPGNTLPPPGWGAKRPADNTKGEADVRIGRRDRVRGN